MVLSLELLMFVGRVVSHGDPPAMLHVCCLSWLYLCRHAPLSSGFMHLILCSAFEWRPCRAPIPVCSRLPGGRWKGEDAAATHSNLPLQSLCLPAALRTMLSRLCKSTLLRGTRLVRVRGVMVGRCRQCGMVIACCRPLGLLLAPLP
jgi:hypothetical protein